MSINKDGLKKKSKMNSKLAQMKAKMLKGADNSAANGRKSGLSNSPKKPCRRKSSLIGAQA